jgi:hypothetical protein
LGEDGASIDVVVCGAGGACTGGVECSSTDARPGRVAAAMAVPGVGVTTAVAAGGSGGGGAESQGGGVVVAVLLATTGAVDTVVMVVAIGTLVGESPSSIALLVATAAAVVVGIVVAMVVVADGSVLVVVVVGVVVALVHRTELLVVGEVLMIELGLVQRRPGAVVEANTDESSASNAAAARISAEI